MFSMFCKHEWEVLSETTTKSDIEAIIERTPAHVENLKTRACSGNRKHIAICSCRKCGKLKRFVEEL
jgi:hypothetical protein